eukprot:1854426-Rhodomonas_salina.2
MAEILKFSKIAFAVTVSAFDNFQSYNSHRLWSYGPLVWRVGWSLFHLHVLKHSDPSWNFHGCALLLKLSHTQKRSHRESIASTRSSRTLRAT